MKKEIYKYIYRYIYLCKIYIAYSPDYNIEDVSYDDDDFCLYYEPIVMHFAHLKEQ